MEVNINRIKSRFGVKILEEDIFKVYHDFKRINDVLKLRLGIEESIVKYFKSKLNIGICNENINKLRMEINGYENDLLLLKKEEFNDLRIKGKLNSFLWNLDDKGCVRSEEVGDIKLERFRRNRDNYSKNYNELNKDNDISRVIM